FLHARGNIRWLRNEVKSPERERPQRDGRSLRAVRADHDHRQPVPPHDFSQHVEAAHSRHLEIERDYLGSQLFNLLKAEVSIHGGADNLNRVVSLKNLRNEFAHQSRIVHYKHSYRLGAHWRTSPAALAAWPGNIAKWPTFVPSRVNRSMTAARFMISTTRPSPKIEAPLTRSVATV